MNKKSSFFKLITTCAIICTFLNLPSLYADSSADAVTKDFEKTNITNGFADLVETIQPAVVSISVKSLNKPTSENPEFGKQSPEIENYLKRYFGGKFGSPESGPMRPAPRNRNAVGSGFIIDSEGLVVTNYHVVENADEIEVILHDGSSVFASLKGADPKTDLALLQINTQGPFPYVNFGDSTQAQIGDWVVAVGNPFGLGGTTTKGIISARGRDIGSGPLDDFIQIDAPINRGNSGGPLFNMSGQVIGVNSAIFSPNGGSVGIGFAIPSSLAMNVIGQIRDTGSVERGFLGVNIQKVNKDIADGFGLDEARGALVAQVVENSPAAKAQLKSGDIILNFNDQDIKDMKDLPKAVALVKSGEKVDLVIWRDNAQETLTAVIGKQEKSELVASLNHNTESGKLGLTLNNLDNETRSQLGLKKDDTGVLVSGIDKNSPVASLGVASGDIIKKIGTDSVSDKSQLDAAIKAARNNKNESVLMLVQKGNNVRYIAVPLEEQNS